MNKESTMSKTYIHHQGFLYGPANKKPDVSEDITSLLYERWMAQVFTPSLPKYKWIGPELPDWSEVVEGKDFEIEVEWDTRIVAVPVLKQDSGSELEALKKENEVLKWRINQLNEIINHEIGK